MGRKIAITVVVAAAALILTPAAGAYVYWTNNNGTIGRAELDGTGADQAFITGPTTPFGVVVDAKHVYWTDDTENAIGATPVEGAAPVSVRGRPAGQPTACSEPRLLAAAAFLAAAAAARFLRCSASWSW